MTVQQLLDELEHLKRNGLDSKMDVWVELPGGVLPVANIHLLSDSKGLMVEAAS